MIYFVACPAANAVKIGYFTTPNYTNDASAAYQRFSVLQTGCPLPLELLAIGPGGPAEERDLHDRFSNERLRGEWFVLSAELRDHIKGLVKPERPKRGPMPRLVAA